MNNPATEAALEAAVARNRERAASHPIGSRWTYEDMANPRTEYVVIGSADGEYELRNAIVPVATIWSDMRQSGWRPVAERLPSPWMDALCESGWTGDRCTYRVGHGGLCSNQQAK